jgi:basic amino acid/polyamine antiporter, APA family
MADAETNHFSSALDTGSGVTHGASILDARGLTLLGLGGVIGAGIFVSVGIAAREKAGPAIIVSFLVAAIACICVALCYCECASRVPIAGSAYAYATAAAGRFAGWLTGWNLVSCYFLAGAAVAQGWSGYFQSLLGAFGLSVPPSLGGSVITSGPHGVALSGAIVNLPALIALAGVTFIVYRGIRISLRANNLLLALKLAVLATVIIVGLGHFNPVNWHNFAPYGWGGATLFGGGKEPGRGMLAGAVVVFFAFGGFEMISAYSQECRNPRTDVPRGVISTIAIITLIYALTAAALTGMVRSDKISINAPISDAFRTAGMPWAQMLVAVGAVIGMTAVLLAVIMSLPRVLQGIAQDVALASAFTELHPHTGTPHRGVLFVGIAAMLVSSLFPLQMVMDFVMAATLSGYAAVCVYVLILRNKQVGSHATDDLFTAPGGVIVPTAGILICILLLMAVPTPIWIALITWWAIGTVAFVAARPASRTAEGALAPEGEEA